ncbi:rho GTPase-activating protein 30 isoform X2 [Alligator mississippiensis]|uniref:rho GTPase-activating protein 30 isoform X2 n=1 Tax=Alligator mississippiensis TaxID=8496 RepID=UPI0003D09354|nr:rho GTPase-activating protein 30 isoform X2 [Alligator mississippiensis]
MSLALKARQKVRRKGAAKDRVFGCDLLEHLQQSGQEVPQVLKCCTEFVEHHGIVDGIYRLSGVSSNIQKLRQEFDSERSPDLNKDVYLQDIHCVSSLCKAYFRELPNPLLTYQLYDKFADAVAIQMEEGRLVKIKEVLKEMPSPHYRTLEFLMKHLVHMASFSAQTNMHARNLAIVWAPNLLRSKDIEASGFNGTAAFMEVRVQSIVVEFILTHVEQLFGDAPLCRNDRNSLRKSLLLSGPLPDGQSFPYNMPTTLHPGDGPPQMRPYHTIIELNEHKRKGSLKAKKWRSIFNLGRSSNDSKRKMTKAEDKDDKSGKVCLRPAKSMDSLSSVPCTNEDDTRLGRKRSQKQPPQRRESFDSPSSREDSFLESEEFPEERLKGEEGQKMVESEGEATAKSEPTTPKPGRASLVGRSPKATRNRAEKCAGVHISGPFSVTVPFHITSNLSLSRLTRGLECPALSYCKEASESPAVPEGGASKKQAAEAGPAAESACSTEDALGSFSNVSNSCCSWVERQQTPNPPAGTTAEGPDTEETRISLELRDSFSFLDSQDAWQDDGAEGDPLPRSRLGETGPSLAGGMMDGFSAMDEDMESGFMNPEEFSVEPPPNYFSIEECMNEEVYYMAYSGSESEDLYRETDSEDAFMSAHDDLSPLASELENLRERGGDPALGTALLEKGLEGDATPEPLCQQPVSLVEGAASAGAPSGSLSSGEDGTAEAPLPGSLAKLCLREEASGDSCVHLQQPELSAATPQEGMKEWDEEDLLLESDCSLPSEGPGSPWAEATTGSVPLARCEGIWEPKSRTGSEGKEQGWGPVGAEPIPQVSGASVQEGSGHAREREVSTGPSAPSTGQLQSGKCWAEPHTGAAPAATQGTDFTAGPDPWPDTGPEAAMAPAPEEGPDTAFVLTTHSFESAMDLVAENGHETHPFLETLPETTLSPEDSPRVTPSLGCSSAGAPQGPEHPMPAAPLAAEPGLHMGLRPDGSVLMRLTASTIRVQQVKSVPVVPPKPQFAKIPPALKPKVPPGEFSTWPQPTTPEKGGEHWRAPPQRQSHPVSLDTSGGGLGATDFSKESSFQKLSKLEKRHSSADSPDPISDALLRQRRASWRSGTSMSFDEAVALAKERHLAQGPGQRIQTYCGENIQEAPSPTKPEKLSPIPKPALRALGQRPLRTLSCTGTPLSPDSSAVGNHPFQVTGLDPACESRPPLSPEPAPFAHDLPPRNRLSLPRLGLRPVDVEEPTSAMPQQRRSLALEVRGSREATDF